MPLFRRNVTSFAESNGTLLTGDVTISEGTGITLTPVGQDISISSSGSGSGDSVKKTFTQTAHGLAVGDAVELDTSANWIEANSSDITKLAIGVVSAVADVNTVEVTFSGYISGLSGLTTGEYHFVSSTTSGSLTINEPASPSYSNPVLIALSTASGIVLPYRPSGGLTAADYDGGSFTDTYNNVSLVDGGVF